MSRLSYLCKYAQVKTNKQLCMLVCPYKEEAVMYADGIEYYTPAYRCPQDIRHDENGSRVCYVYKTGEEDKMLRVGNVVHRYGKAVKIIADLEDGTYVCRYKEDIEGKHPTRCYIYPGDELVANDKLVIHTTVVLSDTNGIVIDAVEFAAQLSEQDIKKLMCEREAAKATTKIYYAFE